MPTGQQLVTQAWIDLGVGQPGQIPPPSMSVNALNKLNQYLDSISGARDLIYEIALNLYLLQTNVPSYAIGPLAAAPFNVQRPIKIENANIVLTVAGATPQRSPLVIITEDQWRSIRDKGATGTTPEVMYFDPQVPDAILNFHPIPATGLTSVELGTWSAIQQIATLATNVTLPPTYYRFLVLALQMELIPTYGNLISPSIIQVREQQLLDALSAVKALNAQVQGMQLPSTQSQQAPSQSQNGSNPQLAQLLQELRVNQASQRQG